MPAVCRRHVVADVARLLGQERRVDVVPDPGDADDVLVPSTSQRCEQGT